MGHNSAEGIIVSSFANVNVEGASTVGGFVGKSSDYQSYINECYSLGDVSGEDNIGGFMGMGENTRIERCYSTGIVAGTSNLSGFANGNNITNKNCFWDKDLSGMDTSGYGLGKAAYEMRSQATFTSWNFTDIWAIDEGNSYPYFQWQGGENIPYPPGG